MAEKVSVDRDDLQKLLSAAFQIGKDREFVNLTEEEKKKHIDDLINATIEVAMKTAEDAGKKPEEYWDGYL